MRRLRKSDIRALSEQLPVELSPKQDVQQGDDVIIIDGLLSFISVDGYDGWVPALPLLLDDPELLPSVVVDMGAVRFMARGADVMRPGITDIPDFSEGDLVVVVDEKNHKPLAVGHAILDSDSMRQASEGRVITTLHYVNDDFWNRYRAQ